MYFVSRYSDIYSWFEANKKYFKVGSGEKMTIFVENLTDIDFSEIENQNRIHSLNDAF